MRTFWLASARFPYPRCEKISQRFVILDVYKLAHLIYLFVYHIDIFPHFRLFLVLFVVASILKSIAIAQFTPDPVR